MTIPEAEQDKRLLDKLRAELPGILRWAVEGCLLWQKHGLDTPAVVRSATAAYRDEMDILGEFLNDCCVIGPQLEVTSKALYAAYEGWCLHNGEKPLSKNAFGMRLAERGFGGTRRGARQARGWTGIGLKAESNEP